MEKSCLIAWKGTPSIFWKTNMFKSRTSRLAGALLRARSVPGRGPQSVHAATAYYWDPQNSNSSGGGGSGTWNTSSWWVSGADGPWANGGDAYFGGSTSGTVTLSGSVSANNLYFNTAGYMINSLASSNTLTLTGGSITMNATSGTISSVIAGSNGLKTYGSGTLVFLGPNTYTSDTNVNSGILQIGPGGSIGSGSNNVNIGSGTLAVSGGTLNVEPR